MGRFTFSMLFFLIFQIFVFSAPFILNKGHYDSVTDIAKYPYGNIAISVSSDESIILWDITNNKILKTIELGKGSLSATAISPSGKYFVAGTNRGEVFIFDFNSQTLLFRDSLHKAKITSIVFPGKDNIFLSAGLDNNVFAYDINAKFIKKGISMPAKILSLSVSPDRFWIAAGGEKGNIYLISHDTLEITNVISSAHSDWVTGVSFSPSGKQLASVSWDFKMNIFSIPDGRVVKSIPLNTDKALNSVDWSGDDKMICISSSNSNIYLYNTSDFSLYGILSGHKGQVYRNMFFSNDSSLVISTGADARVNLWSTNSKELLKTFTGY
jgi:WD40 repeat protein